MKVNIFIEKEVNFPYQDIIDDIVLTLNRFFMNDKEIGLIIVDEQKIRTINKIYRQIDKVTDVISFQDDENDYLGDIFICAEKVYEQANLYNHSIEREFAFLLCHGILHLLGYNHLDEDEEKVMFALQDKILNTTKYKREVKK